MSIRAVTAFVFAAVSFASYAADFPPPKQGEWTARDFKFHTGEVMPALRIHYTTKKFVGMMCCGANRMTPQRPPECGQKIQ